MTTEEIQAKINSLPRYIPLNSGYDLYFAQNNIQETYVLTATLKFDGFYGGGQLKIGGDENYVNSYGAHLDQRAVFDGFTNAVPIMFQIDTCYCRVKIYNIRFLLGDSVNNGILTKRGGHHDVRYCSFEGSSQSGMGIRVDFGSTVFSDYNYFVDLSRAYYAVYGGIISAQSTQGTIAKPNAYLAYAYGGLNLLGGNTDVELAIVSQRGGITAVDGHANFKAGTQTVNP